MSEAESQLSQDRLQSTQEGIIHESTSGGESDQASQLVANAQELYSPLPEGRYIRLLELAPGNRKDPRVVRMFVVALSEAPNYAALSYVWGAPGETTDVVCNGLRIVVTANLGAALDRVRHRDKSRILWADAICIDQSNLHERGHHVGFMGKIYEQAKQVLVCLGPDPDGGASDVAALIMENADLVSRYGSVEEMPILPQDDPVFDDPRWKAVATMTNCVWFTRTWVVQEVGLASNPRALYGDVEFSYHDLMTLATWVTRCASHLTPRANVDFYTIHTDWLNWTREGQGSNEARERTFLDLLNHARWLACMDPRDHVYAFLGHPLAQLNNGNETIVKPDYSKHFDITYLEIALQLLRQEQGLRVLSTVEHDEQTIDQNFPSWVTRWNVEQVMCTLGIYSSFHYDASMGMDASSLMKIDNNLLEIQGAVLDVVINATQFSAVDLEDPMKLWKETSATVNVGTLEHIWAELQELLKSHPQHTESCLNAFSLTLTAGLTNNVPAEDNLFQHSDNFDAYWLLMPEQRFPRPLLSGFMEAATRGDAHRFWLDMRQVCDGRSFCITEKGHFALGPCVTEPGDLCCIIFGGKVPFILRKTEKASQYKLVGEAYIHKFMRGEAMQMVRNGELQEEIIKLC
jgi:hypothetical protein